MKLVVITPVAPRGGNHATTVRVASILSALGHDVTVGQSWTDERCDAIVILHAWRSATSIFRFRERYPNHPLVVILTGTDIYHYQHADPGITRQAMECADVLVGLHDRVSADVPAHLRSRVRVIRQSAPRLPMGRPARADGFDVLVVAHLRDIKDPLRTAYAVRQLPANSTIRVTHLGASRTSAWRDKALAENRNNPRYRWLGAVPPEHVQHHLARSRVLVVTSRAEGGANVISEATMAGCPVVASDIAGNVGLLGASYPGMFRVGDTAALASLLWRAETDGRFMAALERHCAALEPRFERTVETEAWQSLINDLRG